MAPISAPPGQRDALKALATRTLAGRSLTDFARYVYPNFDDPPHIKMIASLAQRVVDRDLRNLAISLPVRHGKSVLLSQLLPAFFLGSYPEKNVILASHSADLAERNSRVARNILADERWPFPEVRLASDSSSVQRWNTQAGGGCYAIGVGGGITGRGGDLLIIDDALHDGLSASECESAYRWYSEVAIPRLEPGGAVILVGARFSPIDLIGRVLESEDGPNFHCVQLPALAGIADPLGRLPGEALWPARMDVTELERRRVQMGSRAFESQFQQSPQSVDGNIFKREWFKNYSELPKPQSATFSTFGGISLKSAESGERFYTITAVDCASKVALHNDFSAIVTLISDGKNMYVIDVVRKRLEFVDLARAVVDVYHKHQPSVIFVEDASAGIPLVAELKRLTALPIVAVPARGSKIARAESVAPKVESGRVFLPLHAPWLKEFSDEILAFPGSRFDDQTDAFVLGLTMCEAAFTRQRMYQRNSAVLSRGFMQR